jgi:RND family efflux transporter MFP subunit
VSDQLSSDLASLRIDRSAASERGGGGGRGKALLVWLLALAAAGAAVYFLLLPAIKTRFARPAVQVTEIALVSPSQGSVELTATGYVVPQRVSQVSAKVGGRVIEVKVKQGDEVEVGDVLMLLDPVDLDAQIASARARVASAQANVATARATLGEVEQQRARELKAQESGISGAAVAEDLGKKVESQKAMIAAAAAQARAAQAEVAAMSIARGNFKVTSPISGRIVNKPAQPGELVGPAMAGIASSAGALEIADFTSLMVEADVPEIRLGQIAIGAPAEITLDAFPGRRLRGEIAEIVPKVDRAKATVPVKVKFVDPADGVLPEMQAKVSVLSAALDAQAIKAPPKLVVPASAVVDRGGSKVVFALEDDRVRMVAVEVGAPFGSGLELVKGPAARSKIVKDPPADLADGAQIKETSDE